MFKMNTATLKKILVEKCWIDLNFRPESNGIRKNPFEMLIVVLTRYNFPSYSFLKLILFLN